MPIQFSCACGRQLQASEEHVGRRTRCPACGEEMRIPDSSAGIQPGPRDEGRRAPPDDSEAIAQEPARRERRPTWEAQDEEDDRAADWQGPPRTSGKAIWSLILGLLSFVFCLLTGIPALILGIGGLGEINQSRNRIKGRGLAVTGIILGSIGIFLVIPYLIGGLVIGIQRVRGAANRMASSNNLRQLTLATINYADMNQGRMPPAVVYDKNGRPLYSWRVLILPDLGEDPLFQAFNLEEPWDSPNNRPLVASMPRVFRDPGRDAGPDLTYYQVLDGPGAAFDSSHRPGQVVPFQVMHRGKMITLYRGLEDIRYPGSFTDGSSNTFLIVEARDAVAWASPRNIAYDPKKPVPNFGDPSKDTFTAAFADGSVQQISHKTAEPVLRAYITRAGND
jgi:hypothetical protein